LADVALLEQKIAEARELYEKAQTPTEKRNAKERKVDLMRLRRVEQVYVSVTALILFQWLRIFVERIIACFPWLDSCSSQTSSCHCLGWE
jgi:hypothetical protein